MQKQIKQATNSPMWIKFLLSSIILNKFEICMILDDFMSVSQFNW